MTSPDRVSITELPQPVVLVVGDDSSYFSTEVWDGVVTAAHGDAGEETAITWDELEPILALPYHKALAHLKRRGWGRALRPPTRVPIPLQCTHPHGPNKKNLRDNLRKILDLFDVWGIIASASAGDVRPLRDALEGIDIPLLVTTDSTTVTAADQLPNELRLMPSNQAQATAMLFAAIRVEDSLKSVRAEAQDEEKSGAMRDLPPVAYSWEGTPQARDYVSNLRTQLEDEAGRLGITLEDFNDRRDILGPLIVIGYADHAQTMIDNRLDERLTILSDGCATQAVYEAVQSKRSADREYWYVARPEVALHDLGRTSFAAIAEAGRDLLMWDGSVPSEASLPKTSLRDAIKEILVDTNESWFNFDGIENVAPAYRVVPIWEEQDLDKSGPTDQQPIPIKPRSARLRAV